MYEESKEMKLLRDIRDKHHEETKGMNSNELINFYKQKAEKFNRQSDLAQGDSDDYKNTKLIN